VILPETSPEMSEQFFCTNVASEQKKLARSSSDYYGANLQGNCSKKFVLMMQNHRPNVATKIFTCSIMQKNSSEVVRRDFDVKIAKPL
jgi:hypothetical protein